MSSVVMRCSAPVSARAQAGRAAAPARLSVVASSAADNNSAAAAPTRRTALLGAGLALSTAIVAQPLTAEAAYGDSARIFGKQTKTSEFTVYVGDNYTVDIPSKWNPDSSVLKGSDLRYADNMRDDGANLDVIITPTSKTSIEEYGSLEQFLPEVSYLLGSQSYDGATDSEGGFKTGRVAAGSLLDLEQRTDQKGKSYYFYHILTRTADGEGGGRHHVLVSSVSGGKLYTLQVQTLDKQWFKGQDKTVLGVAASFTLA